MSWILCGSKDRVELRETMECLIESTLLDAVTVVRMHQDRMAAKSHGTATCRAIPPTPARTRERSQRLSAVPCFNPRYAHAPVEPMRRYLIHPGTPPRASCPER